MDYFNDITFDNFAFIKTRARRRASTFQGYYGVQYVFEGNIEVAVDNSPWETARGPVIFFTFPDAIFDYGSVNDDIRRQGNVCFSGPRVDRYIQQGLFPIRRSNVFFYPKAPQEVLQLMLELQQSLRLPDVYHQAHAVLLLEELLLQIAMNDAREATGESSYQAELKKLCEKMAAAPGDDWNFHDEAEALSISDTHFRRIFKIITGISPVQYLTQCRIRAAKEQLLTTHKRIYEIGHDLNFQDEFHFSKVFRKVTGKSPRQFRMFYGGEVN